MSTRIDKILSDLNSRINRKKIEHLAVAMFDLSGSTKLKLTEGHSIGTQTALEHNYICEIISREYDGSVIKHMGDGIFIEFKNPLNACHAALEVKKTFLIDRRFETKIGISLGSVESIEINGNRDLLGSTVDRCARLTTLAKPNQILIDYALRISCESFLRDEKEIIIGDSFIFDVKGIGDLAVTELSLSPYGLLGYNIPYMKIIEEGRMPLKEKMAFMACAKHEVIELGVGLTSFSDYFSRRSSTEFKEKIISLMRNDVTLKIAILNPDSEYAKLYVEDNKEPDYIASMKKSKENLLKIKDDLKKIELEKFQILMYDRIPSFHATCIDIEDTLGMMSISHYLPYTLRAENPVIQFSSHSNPKMFIKYKSAIEKVLKNAIEIK